jgi:hypothetical protein
VKAPATKNYRIVADYNWCEKAVPGPVPAWIFSGTGFVSNSGRPYRKKQGQGQLPKTLINIDSKLSLSARDTGRDTHPASPVVPAVLTGGCVSIYTPVGTGTDVSTGREL